LTTAGLVRDARYVDKPEQRAAEEKGGGRIGKKNLIYSYMGIY
jgi:hypothetical protein